MYYIATFWRKASQIRFHLDSCHKTTLETVINCLQLRRIANPFVTCHPLFWGSYIPSIQFMILLELVKDIPVVPSCYNHSQHQSFQPDIERTPKMWYQEYVDQTLSSFKEYMMRIALFLEKKDSSTKIVGALRNSELGIENETFDSSKIAWQCNGTIICASFTKEKVSSRKPTR